MIVAYCVTDNEEPYWKHGFLEKPGDKRGHSDLYEASVSIRAFDTKAEADEWLAEEKRQYETGDF